MEHKHHVITDKKNDIHSTIIKLIEKEVKKLFSENHHIYVCITFVCMDWRSIICSEWMKSRNIIVHTACISFLYLQLQSTTKQLWNTLHYIFTFIPNCNWENKKIWPFLLHNYFLLYENIKNVFYLKNRYSLS